MDQRQTFSQTLQQWVTIYARANDQKSENDAFHQLRLIARDMEAQKILKPIIFYQFVMTIQALTSVLRITFTEAKIKKMMAILYPDDMYVSDLTRQVMSAINIADTIANSTPGNAEVLEQLRGRPIQANPAQHNPAQPQIFPQQYQPKAHGPPSGPAN